MLEMYLGFSFEDFGFELFKLGCDLVWHELCWEFFIWVEELRVVESLYLINVLFMYLFILWLNQELGRGEMNERPYWCEFYAH